VHDPVRAGAEALALGAHVRREDFAEIDPDDRSLRDSKERDETNQKREQKILVRVRTIDEGHADKADSVAHCADQEQCFATELVNEADADEGCNKIRGSDDDCLHVCADGTEAGAAEDVVEVVEDGIDAGELIEESDRNGQEDQQLVAADKEMIVRGSALSLE